jgi:ABC-type multidrug transport system fused ATPase/permease subunit
MFSYILTTQLRKISLVLIIIMGIICTIYIVKNSKKDNIGVILAAMFLGYVSLFAFLLIAGDVTFIERGFIFSLLILPILIVKSISIGTKTKLYKPFCVLVILFFAFSVFTFPVTYQGAGPYVVPSSSEISAENFINNNPAIKNSIGYSYGGSPFVFNKYWYNYLSLKHDMGNEYIESFNMVGLNELYDSGQSMVFFTSNNETVNKLIEGTWKYTSYK